VCNGDDTERCGIYLIQSICFSDSLHLFSEFLSLYVNEDQDVAKSQASHNGGCKMGDLVLMFKIILSLDGSEEISMMRAVYLHSQVIRSETVF